MADDDTLETVTTLRGLSLRTRGLESGANAFARAMTSAFAGAVTSGKQFDDVLKSLALRLSNIALRLAFKPIESGITSGLQSLMSSLTGGGASSGAGAGIRPFASGGVIGTPGYFPMLDGGVGVAGEAGPEAIMPLRRGPDGRLGVAAGSGGSNVVNVTIATPDADSFRRSETFIAGQIARAVARGQRSL